MTDPPTLDLTDSHIRAMADQNHQPCEYWTMGGALIGLSCRECNQPWPCRTRQALNAWAACECVMIDVSTLHDLEVGNPQKIRSSRNPGIPCPIHRQEDR